MSASTKANTPLQQSVLTSLGAVKQFGETDPKSDTQTQICFYQWFEHGEHSTPTLQGVKQLGLPTKKTDFYHCDQLECFLADQQSQPTDYWGVLTSRFTEQLGLSTVELGKMIRSNLSYDLFFFNPTPSVEVFFHNLWVQGNTRHPDFLKMSEVFLAPTQLGVQVTKNMIPSRIMATGNCFAGNAKFWGSYIPFVQSIYKQAIHNLSQTDLASLRDPKADARDAHFGADYFRFIEERLLTEYLLLNPDGLKILKVQSPRNEARLNKHEKSIRLIRDLAVKNKDSILLQAWASYVDLYAHSLVPGANEAIKPSVKASTKKTQDKLS